ncbi:MAG: DUF4097 family beta strand repeat-containing protein [Bacillota bacterium]|nr:DUF4097 family beta strand repeat-containing protein [Bacillota bacterium]
MGEEERRLILQMVAEGRVTPEEAVRLLEALEGAAGQGERPVTVGKAGDRPPSPARAEPQDTGEGERQGRGARRAPGSESGERVAGGAAEPGANAAGVGPELGEGMARMGAELGDRMARMGSEMGEKMADMGSGIAEGVMKLLEIFPWAGAEFRDHLSREGEFLGDEPRQVSVELANGRLIVEGWDGPGWRLEVDTQARGRQAHKAADLVTVEADEKSLKVRSARFFGGNYSVSGVLRLPPGEYHLRGATSNGRISARGLCCRVLDLETSNGRIEVEDIEGDRVELDTSNGAIVAWLSARRLQATTSNGSIRVEARAIRQDTYELRTSNGSIRLICPDPEAGYRVDASTSLGGIVVDLPGMPRQSAKGAAARAQLQVATPGFEGKECRLDARLRTSCGSITVSTQEE